MINIIKTYLLPSDEYTSYLERIWTTGMATNNGELIEDLEKMAEYLDICTV